MEKVYHEALCIELERNKIPYKNEQPIKVHYLGKILESSFIADFVCYEDIILEIKAVNQLDNQHLSQLMNYLAAANGSQLSLRATTTNIRKRLEA